MAKLMWIAGIVLVAVGVALGLMVFFSTASIVGWGLTGDTAAILLVGGILALGLGGVINAVETAARVPAAVSYSQQAAAPAAIPEFGRRASETVAPAVAAAVAAEEVSPEVKQTIQALEKAKQDLSQAFEAKPEPEAQPEPAVTEPEAVTVVEVVETVVEEEIVEPAESAEDESIEDGQLYVVEERTIRNRPARILSDGTVEAETEEGWMRFENLEHLDEYLEAMSPSGQG